MIELMLISMAVGVAQEIPASTPSAISPELQAKFEDFLRDPGTAQIKVTSEKSLSKSGSTEQVICGRYNAKNSYGGYVGFKDFAYRSSNRTLYTDGTAVRPSGIDSIDDIITQSPTTRAELDVLSAKGDAIIAEVRSAFALCAS